MAKIKVRYNLENPHDWEVIHEPLYSIVVVIVLICLFTGGVYYYGSS